jgi:hypothetical protein
MIGMFAVIAVAMIAAGAALGIVVIVSVGIHREEKAGRRIRVDSPGPMASGARAVTSLGVYPASTTWD